MSTFLVVSVAENFERFSNPHRSAGTGCVVSEFGPLQEWSDAECNQQRTFICTATPRQRLRDALFKITHNALPQISHQRVQQPQQSIVQGPYRPATSRPPVIDNGPSQVSQQILQPSRQPVRPSPSRPSAVIPVQPRTVQPQNASQRGSNQSSFDREAGLRERLLARLQNLQRKPVASNIIDHQHQRAG